MVLESFRCRRSWFVLLVLVAVLIFLHLVLLLVFRLGWCGCFVIEIVVHGAAQDARTELLAAALVLQVLVVDDLRWRKDEDDEQEVDGDDDRREYSKRSDWPDVGERVRHKGDGCRAGRHKDGIERASEAVSHSLVLLIRNRRDIRGLAPRVAKDEDVVSSDAENDENSQLVQRRVQCNLEYTSVDEV